MTPSKPTADRAYAHVRERLLDGRYPGGELLSERAVATELGLSNTPVREAFLRLQAEGFLRLYPRRGALVVPVTPGEAHADPPGAAADGAVRAGRLARARSGGDAPGRRDAAAGRERRTGRRLVRLALDVARAFHTQLMRAGGNPSWRGSQNLWDQQIRIGRPRRRAPAMPPTTSTSTPPSPRAIRPRRRTAARALLTRHVARGPASDRPRGQLGPAASRGVIAAFAARRCPRTAEVRLT
ncbi:GntR family transcriptional regulator [Streptomyces albulus]|nr:GntR family transcriptional regulator [Streptomyces noursei]